MAERRCEERRGAAERMIFRRVHGEKLRRVGCRVQGGSCELSSLGAATVRRTAGLPPSPSASSPPPSASSSPYASLLLGFCPDSLSLAGMAQAGYVLVKPGRLGHGLADRIIRGPASPCQNPKVWDVFGDRGVFLSPTVAAAPVATAASTAVVAPTAAAVTAAVAPTDTAISATIALRPVSACSLAVALCTVACAVACAVARCAVVCRLFSAVALCPASVVFFCAATCSLTSTGVFQCHWSLSCLSPLVVFAGLVITLRLTKENYFSWSPAMTMGIAGRGRMAYIDGSNPEPARTSGVWHTWFLEDNQVKTWIVNSVSADIQPLILRKKTTRDMNEEKIVFSPSFVDVPEKEEGYNTGIEKEGHRLFGQVYSRRGARTEEVTYDSQDGKKTKTPLLLMKLPGQIH
ncbi:hypothetical protein EJ110_NYTH45104 [Nymphaea thermarum]|nr:hypothetical protein EJ110_NYTH45104 [Nymphaea thermarum]